jgi:thioesterase domain-containing protein
LRLYFSADRCDDGAAAVLLRQLAAALAALPGAAARSPWEISLLGEEEQRELTMEPRAAIPGPDTLHGLFEEQVRRAPEAVAVRQSGVALNYLALDERAGRLARSLRDGGVRAGTRVGVSFTPDLDGVITVLAVLKAGATLVPLSPHPAARLLAVLKPDLILPSGTDDFPAPQRLPSSGNPGLATPGASPACRVAVEVDGEVVGVDLPHQEFARRFAALRRRGILEGVPAVFADGAPEPLRDVLLPLASGATLILAGAADGGGAIPGEVTTLLTDGPSLARRLAGSGLPAGVQIVLMTGDLPPARGLADAAACGGGALWTLVDCGLTGFWSLVGRGEAAPLVAPLPGVRIALASGRPGPLPAGAAGELCLGDVPPRNSGELLWRTGQRARRLPEGDLELLGRTRPEPGGDDAGEIEAAFRRHPAVWLARVDTRSDGPWRAIVTGAPGRGLETAEMRNFLHRRLPVLAASLRLEVVPAGAETAAELAAVSSGPAAPRDPLELELVQIWEELFATRPIGIRDDFFALGGHSLLAIRLAAVLRLRFGQDLSLTSLLAASTIEKIALLLRGRQEAAHELPLVALQSRGSRPPLFCLHPAGGGVLCYMDLAYHLGADQPVYGLQAPGWGDEREVLDSVEAMARCYVAAMRRLRPQGPYSLVGWSFGGFVAYEMARQLRLAGEEVAHLSLLDTAVGVDGPREEADEAQILGEILDGVLPLSVAELRRLGGLDAQLGHVFALAGKQGLLPADFDPRQARRLVEVYRASHRAALGFNPGTFPGRLTLFRAEEAAGPLAELGRHDPTYGWGRLAAEVEVRVVPGRHETLIRRPWVESLAAELIGALDASS